MLLLAEQRNRGAGRRPRMSSPPHRFPRALRAPWLQRRLPGGGRAGRVPPRLPPLAVISAFAATALFTVFTVVVLRGAGHLILPGAMWRALPCAGLTPHRGAQRPPSPSRPPWHSPCPRSCSTARAPVSW
ncbi:hypothetical protein QJS66_07480 [Kocuria rhizophila]|nr:hypothetical protein QJS66_07480 [Kocuria rhizophila]